jgi:hypothetical protein
LYMQKVRKWTNDQGKFELDVPPGTYVLGINTDGPVVVKYPFPPTYFPGATERTFATSSGDSKRRAVRSSAPLAHLARAHNLVAMFENHLQTVLAIPFAVT